MVATPRVRRRTIRLANFDYTGSAAYFVTLVTRERAELFGDVVDGEMRLNSVGEIVLAEWLRSSEIRRELELDEFMVMPNHLHGIVIFRGHVHARAPEPITGAHSRAPLPLQRAPRSLGSFVSAYKATTTRAVKRAGLARDASIWQRNYFERVIRGESEADRIRQYILDNPARWQDDPENARRPSP